MADARRLTRSKRTVSNDDTGDAFLSPPTIPKLTAMQETKPSKTKRNSRISTNYKKKKGRGKKQRQIEGEASYHIKTMETFDIGIRVDLKLCSVWTMCLLDSGDLLITDRGDTLLKQIKGDTYEVRHTLELGANSHSVCKVNENEALVALSDYRLQFVSIKENLVATRSLKMDHVCLGICVIDNKIYVTDGINRNLYIYDMEGNMLKKVGREGIFSWNRYVVKSDDGNALYVTDMKNGLVKMDKNGEVIWKCSDLNDAYGLCTDGLGNVFVSEYDAGKVVQVNPDGQYVGEIISSDIPKAASLCFDNQKSKLFVSIYRCNKIRVYCLK